MKERFIALVDADNFFASCEQLFRPDLAGKPVCVLSNNDGCVIARSREAKKLGIKMGMPYFMAKKDFPQAVYISSNFTLYHDISNRLRDIYRKYSETIDIYSIDEAFFDVSGLDKVFHCDYISLAKRIRDEVREKVGVWVSVGIANSKTLAKLAVHKAKHGDGIYIIEKSKIKDELEGFPVEEIWGIGRATASVLKSYGLFYASDIISQNEDFLRKLFGVRGLELKQELSGENFIGIQKKAVKAKSIQRTCAFPEFSSDKNYIKSWLFKHLHNACRCAREDNLKAASLGVMLRTKEFQVFYRTIGLKKRTNSEIDLIKYLDALFDSMFEEDIIYRASGICLNELEEELSGQISLFNSENSKKTENIATVWDKIEQKFGKGIISLGTVAVKRKHSENRLKNV